MSESSDRTRRRQAELNGANSRDLRGSPRGAVPSGASRRFESAPGRQVSKVTSRAGLGLCQARPWISGRPWP